MSLHRPNSASPTRSVGPQLHVEVRGPATGPALLLVHGFMSSNVQWDLNIEALTEYFQVARVELMGHGQSPSPTEPAGYLLDHTLSELERIRIELGRDQWWVGGHSLGGATVLRYALAHPGRTQGVVFTNTRAAFGLPQLPGADTSPLDQPISDVRSLPYHPINAKRFPPDIKERMVEKADAMQLHAIRHTVANRHNTVSASELHQLTMPVLLLNGRYERAFQPCVAVARAALTQLAVVDLEGGHSINVEAPDDFNREVVDFINAHPEGVQYNASS